MSATTTADQPAGVDIITIDEQATCLRCESSIPPYCIDKKIPTRRRGSTMQHVTLACPGCGTVYQLDRVLHQGNFVRSGSVHVLHGKAREAAVASLNAIRGDRQLRTVEAA